MSLTATIAVDTYESVCGPFDPNALAAVQKNVGDAVAVALRSSSAVVLAEAEGCRLHYLDVSSHPFRDLGDWRTLAGLPRSATGMLPDGARAFAVRLPLTAEATSTISDCARALGIPVAYTADAVDALLRISLALARLEARYRDQPRVRPVVRALGTDIQRMSHFYSFKGMGAVADTRESVGNAEVWADDSRRPADAPLFFVFR